jgi:hypothetical protein
MSTMISEITSTMSVHGENSPHPTEKESTMTTISERRAAAAESERARCIRGLCELADKPEAADDFIRSDRSFTQVACELMQQRASDSWTRHVESINRRIPI